MKLPNLTLALGLAGICWSATAWSQADSLTIPRPPVQIPPIPTSPPRTTVPPPLPPPPPKRGGPPQPPQTTNAEPSTADSEELTTRAANAAIAGNPQEALRLADQAVGADPRDPWAHYQRGAALARMGRTDDALRAFAAAEERFAANDVWARAVTMYGTAHALAEAGRCQEAQQEYIKYASFIRERDPRSADMAIQYAHDCKAPQPPEPGAAP